MTVGRALGVLFGLGWIPLFVFRAEAIRAALPVYSRGERFWVQLTPAVLSGHMTFACITICGQPALPRWRAALGAGLFVGALAFWFWGRVQIGPLRERRLPDEPPPQLRRNGAFGVVRNPLYLGYLTAAGAPLVVAPQLSLCASFALSAVALGMRAVQEERRLHAQLGPAYGAYCREVKRLVPYIW